MCMQPMCCSCMGGERVTSTCCTHSVSLPSQRCRGGHRICSAHWRSPVHGRGGRLFLLHIHILEGLSVHGNRRVHPALPCRVRGENTHGHMLGPNMHDLALLTGQELQYITAPPNHHSQQRVRTRICNFEPHYLTRGHVTRVMPVQCHAQMSLIARQS